MPPYGYKKLRSDNQLSLLIEQEVLRDLTDHADGTEEAIASTLVCYTVGEVRRAVTGLIQNRLVQRTDTGKLVVTSKGAKATPLLGWIEQERRKLRVKHRPID